MDIIIPIHQIFNRGLERVYNSLYSLSLQTVMPNHVWVINSSRSGEFRMLDRQINHFKFATHVNIESKEFNKCKMLNKGIGLSEEKYVMCTDADYMFRKDFVETCHKHLAGNKLLLKAVYNLPKIKIGEERIKAWVFPKGDLNFYRSRRTGENLANGACQLTTKQWFTDNPYDERMKNLGGMDNLCVYKALKQGLDIEWMEDSQILHQWHQVSKLKRDPQFEKNQKIIREYFENN